MPTKSRNYGGGSFLAAVDEHELQALTGSLPSDCWYRSAPDLGVMVISVCTECVENQGSVTPEDGQNMQTTANQPIFVNRGSKKAGYQQLETAFHVMLYHR